MTKEEKIKSIQEIVAEYNTKHKATAETISNAGEVEFYNFNSTKMIEEINLIAAEDNLPSTSCEEWELEPDTEYYELEVFKYEKVEGITEEYRKEFDIPTEDVYHKVHKKQILTKDLSYFYNKVREELKD